MDSERVMMNELIKKLAEQARIQMCSDARLQEFAELIINECTTVVDKHEPFNTWNKRYSTLIKEHFGIEK